jgi:gliding motility-associated-like protein
MLLRVSSQEFPATVRVLQPALGVELANFSIAANSTRSINLSNITSNLETILPATVMKTGLRIVSTAPITAYYEEASSLNAEIFVLKGRNALGQAFYIPWQNVYDNSPQYSPTPYGSFDIVATRNNTLIKVYPTGPLVGHEGEQVITVRLNAGETYSFRKTSLQAFMNPAGTRVTSSKPIAITLKDDSVIKNGCRDLIGDQLIPIKVAGMEYIVTKGFLDAPEYLFITATENDTEVYISGTTAPATRLNAGQSYRLEITLPSIYIRATKRVYVLHVTGFGCEVGMGVLPPINCTGSKEIGFTRSTDEFFGMIILVRKEGVFDFVLNGTSPIPANRFMAVPGTNGDWYTAQISYTTTEVPVNATSIISNNIHSFQAGLINGNAASTCRYGYFSAFSTLFLGDDINLCMGENTMIDAGPGKEQYLWNTGETSQAITVDTSGYYAVRVVREDCILTDTVHVEVREGFVDLGSDVELCDEDTMEIDGKDNFRWTWSDGSKDRYLSVTQPGTYWVDVIDDYGCPARDSIVVSQFVSMPDDSVGIFLRYVTVDTSQFNAIGLAWSILRPERIPNYEVTLYKRPLGNDTWEKTTTIDDQSGTATDVGSTHEEAYAYFLELADQCGGYLQRSLVHNTMLLTGEADSTADVVTLYWNPYLTWTEGVDKYEIYRRLENTGGLTKIASVDGMQLNYAAAIGADGFVHEYVIRAIERNGAEESWSNIRTLNFDHQLNIPNVFTPNGDAFNQRFFIPKLSLFGQVELVVVDRWGKQVFYSSHYQNDWEGSGLSSGVYYYRLFLRRNNIEFKGSVHILSD